MPNLTPTNAGHTTNLANRERWEVIVQHEPPLLLSLIALQPLCIVGRSQRCTDQRLRLTTRKQSRTMNPRQHANFDRHVADLIESTMIRPDSLFKNLLPEDVFAQQ